MKDILFLAHRAPFPPDRGDRIRSYNIFRYLAARARVHLVAFVDDARDLAVCDADRAMLADCRLFVRTKPTWRAAGEALARGEPVSIAAFRDARVAAAVADILAQRPIDAIYAFSGQMAQYLPAGGPRAIMDFVDRDSAKFAAYADRAHGPKRWMMKREARLLQAYENDVAARVSQSLFVSEAEAALLPGAKAIENGIDSARFDPAGAFPRVDHPEPLIVFTGQMDYRPNIEAVEHFTRDVLPGVLRAHPGARFAIVGRAPAAAVRALASDRVIVTGEVPDVRGWIAVARVVVAPLELARGVQNKVLEAMAMARPVVASPAAAEGIDHGGTIRVAGDAEAMAAQICALIADPATGDTLGEAARAQVMRRYGWGARLAPLDALLGLNSAKAAA
ncbi:Glycosyl transferases group 1 [Sphingomonas sp. EC-HK361]|uniref:TIGR03087 family PEP-CTERM/XrtA system glycosyltransferase n=1 Tax=Sphingomonas sp. EC-HK361 TaxID=2038397 RepID=UPI00125ABDDC|nr:TIGR03087 family PEP-CTERM/XrtA system glycosyltransferase [Sphingomonas sp. EC-HK361]VVT03857.1 Glycosyl transferases group 1 [Sphingomonas sp. EC-HK361]